MKASTVLRAQIGCLQCGYDLGEVEGRRGAHSDDLVFLPMHEGDRLIVDTEGRFRCPRCGGQALVNSVRPIQHPIDRATLVSGEVLHKPRKTA